MSLDDTDLGSHFNQAGVPLKGQAAHVPPGYISLPAGRGTYGAKEHLKRLGGYWNPLHKCWYVPEHHAVQARRAVQEAEEGRLGPVHGPVPGRGVTCWECGQEFLVADILTRGGTVADYYCGCGETREDPRRLRRA